MNHSKLCTYFRPIWFPAFTIYTSKQVTMVSDTILFIHLAGALPVVTRMILIRETERWLVGRKRYIQMHLLEWKLFYFHLTIPGVCSPSSNLFTSALVRVMVLEPDRPLPEPIISLSTILYIRYYGSKFISGQRHYLNRGWSIFTQTLLNNLQENFYELSLNCTEEYSTGFFFLFVCLFFLFFFGARVTNRD